MVTKYIVYIKYERIGIMFSNKVIAGLAALTVVISGYAVTELAYQKEKRKSS